MFKADFQDIGLIEYINAWQYQEELHQKVQNIRAVENQNIGYLIFCEHPHVYTLGKSGNQNNLLINDTFLKNIQATYVQTNRGGDITYHGPGQIVGYPILDLQKLNIGIKRYIYNIEEAIIQTLKDYQIKAERLADATGVWIDSQQPEKARKICAIGVRLSKGITMHGFAFNVKTNLDYFNYIVPCGIQNKGVTSIEKELNRTIDINEVKNKIKNHISNIFNISL